MRRLEAALLLGLAAAPRALAQVSAPDTGDAAVRHHREYLVSTEWLALRLSAPDLVVLHVGRDESGYRTGHIPGARYLSLSAVATTVHGIPNEFPPPAELGQTFRALGVGDRGRVVIYGDDAGILAARAWVALDLLGHGAQAALLDGGLAQWTAEQRPLETTAHPAAPQPFTVHWQADRIVGAAWVRTHLGDSGVVFVDARPADQYAGLEPPCPPGLASCVEILPGRRGHLPGARSLFWMEDLVSRENPVLKPMHTLHEELWKATGADRPGVRTLVTYCRSGMQASHAYFVARYVGYRDVRLYDGSFIEWVALPVADYPVERAGR
jgi:thiosulfate/3-mercaptopyruvate sulfurtransferase